MSMFCFQCQEASHNEGCTVSGVCGKSAKTAALQDALMHVARGASVYAHALHMQSLQLDTEPSVFNSWLRVALFTTITNANFDDLAIEAQVFRGLALRMSLKQRCINLGLNVQNGLSHAATWSPENLRDILDAQIHIGVLRTTDPDSRSLRELLTYGLKGLAAYLHHAAELGSEDRTINTFLPRALVATIDPHIDNKELNTLILETGAKGVDAMALLDNANTVRYGQPVHTEVRTDAGERPGILVSGHDLADLEILLEQSKHAGIDVYTHCEMLPAHGYPFFMKYTHLFGNYGNSWWHQHKEFNAFNGPILFTTNCIVPPLANASYANRVFTTGAAGYPGYRHILKSADGSKDFSELINIAKNCKPPETIEQGTIPVGFAHNQIDQLVPSILQAIHCGGIKRFVVMAGCDGRHSQRNYYTDFAEHLSSDTVILTAGCAKYRYNKLNFGSLISPDGVEIPRLLDAGQCNDSYSIALTAIKLQYALGLDDINSLPIAYNIAWYEQKAIIVLLSLLHLGVRNIQLGPTLPAFLSPEVGQFLVDHFGITSIPAEIAIESHKACA